MGTPLFFCPAFWGVAHAASVEIVAASCALDRAPYTNGKSYVEFFKGL